MGAGPAQLYGAADYRFSPNGRYLLTDPGRRFWIARDPFARGHFFSTGIPMGCSLDRFAWLPDSSALAYVDTCTHQHRGYQTMTYTLFTMPVPSGVVHRVLSLHDTGAGPIRTISIGTDTGCACH